MLERTSTSLEPVKLQRIAKVALQAQRKKSGLRPGFWQHGASALELHQDCSRSKRSASSRSAKRKPVRPLTSDLRASAFRLDFLYPNHDVDSLRRAWVRATRQAGRCDSLRSTRRPYASASPAALRDDDVFEETADSAYTIDDTHTRVPDQDANGSDKSANRKRGGATRAPDATPQTRFTKVEKPSKKPVIDTSSMSKDEFMARMLAFDASAQQTTPQQSAAQEGEGTSKDIYRDVYDGYLRLDEEARALLRPAMAMYLAQSFSRVHNDRAKSLFAQIPVIRWTDELLKAAIVVFLRTEERATAVKNFKRGASERGLKGGMDLLLADSLAAQDWASAVSTWKAYYAAHSASFVWFKPGTPDTYLWQEGLLDALSTLENKGAIYLSFDRYLAKEQLLNAPGGSETADHGLQLLRRRLAKHAIQQPCPPDEAIKILGQWSLSHWYGLYFARFGKESKHDESGKLNILDLSQIYQSWRQLPDFELTAHAFYLMAQAYFPVDAAGIDELRRDWIRTRGDLHVYGFRRLLQFYAHIGDVNAVQELWQENFHKHKDNEQHRSTFFGFMIDVYAQDSDPEGARTMINTLIREYGFEPDVQAWNILLKAYARADDLQGAAGCLHDIKSSCTPNSTTYAYILSLCARLGDLDSLHKYFTELRAAKIQVTPDIGRQLVEAYVTNKQLKDGELLATELDTLGVRSAAIWNVLIQGYGQMGRTRDCHNIVATMKSIGIKPNDQTYERLLWSLAQARKTQEAYELLVFQGENRKLFRVSAAHYTMVLMAASRANHFMMVVQLARRWLQRHKGELPFDAQVARLAAAVRMSPVSKHTHEIAMSLVRALVSQLNYHRARRSGASVNEKAPMGQMDRVSMKTQYRLAGLAVELLFKMREHTTLEDLNRLYLDLFPGEKRTEALPPEMLGSLFHAFNEDGEHKKVVTIFDLFLERNLPRLRDPAKGSVYPLHAFYLTRLIEPLCSSLYALDEGDKLLSTIQRLVSLGFKFTTPNWDVMLRRLIELGYWEPAMTFCESHLMKSWRGWPPWNAGAHQPREPWWWVKRFDPKGLRPKVGLVAALQQEFLKLQSLAPWSMEMANKAEWFARTCPQLKLAFDSSRWNSHNWIAQGGARDPRKWDVVLGSLTRAQLRKMLKRLKADLDYVRALRKQVQDAHDDPFGYEEAAAEALGTTEDVDREDPASAAAEEAAARRRRESQRQAVVASRFNGLTEEEVEQIRNAVLEKWRAQGDPRADPDSQQRQSRAPQTLWT